MKRKEKKFKRKVRRPNKVLFYEIILRTFAMRCICARNHQMSAVIGGNSILDAQRAQATDIYFVRTQAAWHISLYLGVQILGARIYIT